MHTLIIEQLPPTCLVMDPNSVAIISFLGCRKRSGCAVTEGCLAWRESGEKVYVFDAPSEMSNYTLAPFSRHSLRTYLSRLLLNSSIALSLEMVKKSRQTKWLRRRRESLSEHLGPTCGFKVGCCNHLMIFAQFSHQTKPLKCECFVAWLTW